MNEITIDTDEDSNSATSTGSETENVVRTTRHSSARLAKKSTTQTAAEKQGSLTRRQAAIVNREKAKFLENFNPESSSREKRKLQIRKQIGLVYDNRGLHINTGRDMCDCLELNCPGCFYPCKKCGSSKCAVECRINRKSKYESIEFHGYNYSRKNPLDK